jgi:FkbM family methyltransferase
MNIKNLSLAMEHPIIIWDRIKGLHPLYSYMCIEINKILSAGTIIDVGANNGWFLKSFNKYFNARTIAFEPNKDFEDELFENSDEHYMIGLGDKNDTKPYFYRKIDHGVNSFLQTHESNEHVSKYDEIKSISVKRFDSLDIDISRPCLLKIDVEGYELKVLEGFGERLKEIDAVLLEYNSGENYVGQPTLKEITDILDKNGIKKMKCLLQGPTGGDLLFYR